MRAMTTMLAPSMMLSKATAHAQELLPMATTMALAMPMTYAQVRNQAPLVMITTHAQ
jgi:hypothetical protein